jgi:hypothetical protein
VKTVTLIPYANPTIPGTHRGANPPLGAKYLTENDRKIAEHLLPPPRKRWSRDKLLKCLGSRLGGNDETRSCRPLLGFPDSIFRGNNGWRVNGFGQLVRRVPR